MYVQVYSYSRASLDSHNYYELFATVGQNPMSTTKLDLYPGHSDVATH